jgi:hypothetical protein
MSIKKISLLLICAFIALPCFGEGEKGVIKGRIIDAGTGKPISFASVALKRGNSYIGGVPSDSTGTFVLKNIEYDNYLLQVNFIGYEMLERTVSHTAAVTELHDIALRPAAMQINEALVFGQAVKENATIERTRINTAKSMGAASGSILEVLRASASVSIDNNDVISIRGNSNVLILINGIPTSLDALGAIPASASKNIEIITSPNVSRDSEGTAGIINIVTKGNEGEGYSGMVQANYGIENRVNGAVALNYSSGRLGLGLNYNSRYEHPETRSALHRLFHATGNTIDQNIISKQENSNHALGINLSYRISPRDILTLDARALFPRNRNHQYLSVHSSADDLDVERENIFSFNRKVFETTLGYKRILTPQKSEWSFLGTFSRTQGSRPAEYYEGDAFIQYSEGGGRPLQFHLQADYSNSLTALTKLEGGLKFSRRSNYFKYDSWVYDTDSDDWVHFPFFSSDLEHRENIGAAYLMLSSGLAKLKYTVGLRAEYSDSRLNSKIGTEEDLNSRYMFLSPYALFSLPVGKNQKMELVFSRRITRPSYPQLNPFVNMIDATTYETGNRNLRPETSHKLELGYALSGSVLRLQSSLYYHYSDNYIAQISTLYDTDALMLTYINGSSDSRTGLDVFANWNISPKFTLSLSSNAFYSDSRYRIDGVEERNSGWAGLGNMALTARPIKGMEMEARYFYHSRQPYPQFRASGYSYLDLGVRQNFAKNRLTASLMLSDVFNTREWDIQSHNPVYTLRNSSKDQTRILWIGLTYRINSYKPTPRRQSEETDRSVIRLGQE